MEFLQPKQAKESKSDSSWYSATSEMPVVAELATGEVRARHSAARLSASFQITRTEQLPAVAEFSTDAMEHSAAARLSASCGITITVQDEFANRSPIFAQEATHKDYLDVLSFKVPAVDESVTKNNVIRSSTIEEMAKMKPVKPHANASALFGDVQSALNRNTSTLKQSKLDLLATRSHVDELSTEVANLNSQLGDVQSALDRNTRALMQDLLATRSHVNELSTEVAKLKSQLGDVQSALDRNTSALMQLSQDQLATRSHVDELATEVAKLKSQSTSYKVKTGIAFAAGVMVIGGLWLFGR